MTPEQRKMWDGQVARARSTDYRYVCHWEIPHEILVAVDTDLADLTRERDEAQIRIQTIQQQYDELGAHADELEQSSRRHVQERNEAVERAERAESAFRHKEAQYDGLRQRCNWFEAAYHQSSDRVWELKPQLAQALQRAETAEAALAEARQHIAHLEDQLADAETARTLAMGIAERAERERDEAMQALIDRTVEAK